MFQKYEIEDMIENKLSELDGTIDDKSDENGEHDMYFVNTEKTSSGIMVNFETWLNSDPKDVEIDRYKICVEYLSDNKIDSKDNKSFQEILEEVDKSVTVDELFHNGEIIEDSEGYETYYSDAPGGTYNRVRIIKLEGKFYVYKEKITIDKDCSEKAECTAFYELK